MYIVSIYDNEQHSKKGGIRDTDILFSDIQKGTYKQEVEEIRLAKHNFKLEEKRCQDLAIDAKNDLKYQKAKLRLKELKGKIHRVTISGKFSDDGRQESNLINHTGLIDIDIDGLEQGEIDDFKSRFIQDEYCQACFVTCGGDGLSYICRIDPSKHNESWEGLKEYFFNRYSLSIDASHKNVANTRNVSYDPKIFVRGTKAKIFKEYIKEKKKKVINNFVYAKTDFELCVSEIVSRRIDFCETYDNYRSIGFSIASKFGESGIIYFDAVCQWNSKYNPKQLSKDYKHFCRDKGSITISTFFARCKEFNIETSSKKTKRIATVTSASRKGGKSKEDTIKNLVKFEDFKQEEVEDIVNQVFDDKIEFNDESTLLDEIEAYIKTNYNLRKNQISGKLENDGVVWNEEDLNGLYIAIKKSYDKADQKWIERIIFSPCIKSYNPIIDFFNSNIHLTPDELLDKDEIPSIIKRLWKSVKTDNDRYTLKFGTKWLVSVVASAFGETSNLELALTGKMNKGKTWFFSHLLPKELDCYFAESKLDSNNSNDDYTLMCQKLIVLMDEGAGKTSADEKKHRNLLDKNIFSIRRPYRKDMEDMQRLAVLCVTSNPQNLLNGDNRRIIPINLLSRDHKEYDLIDKTELWMAVYYIWKNGFEWRIKEEDISDLNQSTLLFQDYSLEYELITKYFEAGDENMMASEIKMFIDSKSTQKLSLSKIKEELKKLRHELAEVKVNGIRRNCYKMRVIGDTLKSNYTPLPNNFNLDEGKDYF